MTHIVADIETAAIRPTDPRWLARAAELAAEREAKIAALLAEPVTAPRNLRDPEKIAAALAERTAARDAEVSALRASLAADIEAARMATALDPTMGRIVCIAWSVDGSEPESASGDDEAEVIALFRDEVMRAGRGSPVFVMHNGKRFDVPFLRVRALVHGNTRAALLFGRWDGKPWDQPVRDTLETWPTIRRRDDGTPTGSRTLSALADLLGVERAPDTITGADVPRLWEGSDADRALVVKHCRADVLTLARVWARLREVV